MLLALVAAVVLGASGVLVVTVADRGGLHVASPGITTPGPTSAGPSGDGLQIVGGPRIPAVGADGQPAWLDLSFSAPSPSAEALPAALTAAPVTTTSVVTPAQAKDALGELWRLHTQAQTQNDGHLLAAVEEGPALESDYGCRPCISKDPTGPITQSEVILSRETSWPAFFLGELYAQTQSGTPVVWRLVVLRRSAADPWKIVFIDGYGPGAGVTFADEPLADQDGYVIPNDVVTADPLPDEFAAYWQGWKNSGAEPPGSPFQPGAWTTEWGAHLATFGQGIVNTGNGLEGRFVFRADVAVDHTYEFPTHAFSLICGTLREEKTWTAPDGGSVNQDLARRNWGSTVAPGQYRAMVEVDIFQPCFFAYAGGPQITVGGADEVTDGLFGIP